MRSFLFALVLLLPQFGWAQIFGKPDLQPGYYVLDSDRNVRHPGDIRLFNPAYITVKDANGKKSKLGSDQVYSFRTGEQQYISGNSLRRAGGRNYPKVFLEQLDSGKVVLLLHEYVIGTRDGGLFSGRFRKAVGPFLATRPDLVKLLEDNQITLRNLPEAIQALNTGQPLVPAGR